MPTTLPDRCNAPGVAERRGDMPTEAHAAAPPGADPDRRDRLAALYREEHADMVRLAHLLTGSSATAEDLVHEAFLRVYDTIGRTERPGAYLRRTVVNLCHSHHRRRGVEARWRERQAPPEPALPPELDETWRAVQALPVHQREALVLRFHLDLKVADVAALLGRPVGTVKSDIHRGLAALTEELAP